MFEKFEKHIIDKVKNTLTEIVVDLADAIDEKTPEDTYELISRNQIEMPHIEWDSIKARVFNDDPKAVFVEYGQEPKTMNYYKWSGRRKWWTPFHQGVGARMFSNSLKEKLPEIKEKLWTIIKQ